MMQITLPFAEEARQYYRHTAALWKDSTDSSTHSIVELCQALPACAMLFQIDQGICSFCKRCCHGWNPFIIKVCGKIQFSKHYPSYSCPVYIGIFFNHSTIKVSFEATLLIEAAVGLEGHSLTERVCIKIQQNIYLSPHPLLQNIGCCVSSW